MSSLLLKMKGISKGFPGVQALSNVSLDLHHGEVVALVGENGAGKSTLMKILTGIYQADKGEVYLEGKLINPTNTRDAQEMGINIIHQELNLMPDLTVAQNIFIGREPKGLGKLFLNENKLNDAASELFKKLNIELNPRQKVSELTVAKQQMVEISKALSYNAKILVMDEPTAALTDKEIQTLFSIIEGLKENGVGVIYISHRMEELKQITDRITIMRDGEYIDTLQTSKAEMDHIISLMVGRKVFTESSEKNYHKNIESVLEVSGVSNEFVKDVSFELKKGEILGFAGLVGAGRTEVARAIFGADKIQSGEIKVNGKKVDIKQPRDAVKHGIGYLSEDRKQFGLMVDMDVKTNILISSMEDHTKGLFVKRSPIASISKEYVEKLKVKTPSINQKVKFLSGGNQQKVVIAKWLVRDSDILIFDEPTRGIDVGAKGEIYELLNQLIAQGKSIIMISSELPEILRMSHRVIVMCEGVVTGELEGKEATQEKIMELATRVQRSKQ